MYIIWLEGKFERAEQYATHKKNLHEQRLTLSTSSLSLSTHSTQFPPLYLIHQFSQQ